MCGRNKKAYRIQVICHYRRHPQAITTNIINFFFSFQNSQFETRKLVLANALRCGLSLSSLLSLDFSIFFLLPKCLNERHGRWEQMMRRNSAVVYVLCILRFVPTAYVTRYSRIFNGIVHFIGFHFYLALMLMLYASMLCVL